MTASWIPMACALSDVLNHILRVHPTCNPLNGEGVSDMGADVAVIDDVNTAQLYNGDLVRAK